MKSGARGANTVSREGLSAMQKRAEFEAWFADSRRNRGAKRRPNFDTLSDGTYADDHTQRHWWTWQTAQAAERERCAKLVEAGIDPKCREIEDEALRQAAARIRVA